MYNKLSPQFVTYRNDIYYLSFCESGRQVLHSWVFWLWALKRLPSRCQRLSQNYWKKHPFNLIHVVVSSIQFFNFIGQIPPLTPCSVGIFLGNSTWLLASTERESEKARKSKMENHNVF